MLSATEVAKHNSRTSCWVIIAGQVYDVTDFLDDHPGGANVILRYGGKDATEEYDPIHPAGTIEQNLSKEKHLGPVDPATVETKADASQEPPQNQQNEQDSMPLHVCQNLDDIEEVARKKLLRNAWVYYNSASDSLSALRSNREDWSKVTFRPRVLRNVARVNMQRRIMGHNASLPFFIAPAARAKLGHPDGELCLARAATETNLVYCASTVSSVAHEELAPVFRNGSGALAFQLYVPKNKKDTPKLIAKARSLGCSALVITVDSPVIGRREEDDRYKAELEIAEGQEISRTSNVSDSDDTPVWRAAHNSTLDWNDLTWIRNLWGKDTGPVILKGIATAEDAVMAVEAGIDGIYLSNHGGRQLDYAPSSIQTLLEIRKFHPHLLAKADFYLDGGVRRGSDIVKAICLGACGVGLGRPFMYALSAFGTDGVLKAIDILSDEIQTTMRLLGVTDLRQLNEHYVNTSILERDLPSRLPPVESWRESKL